MCPLNCANTQLGRLLGRTASSNIATTLSKPNEHQVACNRLSEKREVRGGQAKALAAVYPHDGNYMAWLGFISTLAGTLSPSDRFEKFTEEKDHHAVIV